MQKQKILIVDDTTENILILMNLLKDQYAIVVAKNGERALEMARTEPPPDCILLDIMMPEMDGYEVCEHLKKDVRTAGIPVVFISALSEEVDEMRGFSLGAVDYITKPYRPELVKARIRNHLELKRHRDDLESMVQERGQELALVKEVTIECLASLTEYRDPETGGHIKRTQNYVRMLARQVKTHPRFAPYLDDEMIETLYLSAPLHDVGKVAVPDAILLKKGKLSSSEFDEMKLHTVKGGLCLKKAEQSLRTRSAVLPEDEFSQMKQHTIYGERCLTPADEIVGSHSFLGIAREIAYGHHEKWDGTGYPQGLSGEDIPVCARIMAVADVYDALISRRVYKPPFPHPKAVAIILEGRGSHFDPDLVDAFLVLQEQFRLTALKFSDFDDEREALSFQYAEEGYKD